MGAIASLSQTQDLDQILVEYRTEFLPNLIHKKTRLPYVLHKFSCGSPMENDLAEANIKQYRQNKCQSISTFHQYFVREDKSYCSHKTYYYMIFRGHQKNTVRQQYERRAALSRSFNMQEIETILESILCGLRAYHFDFGRGYQSFSLDQVVIEDNSQRIYLRDPWLSNSESEIRPKLTDTDREGGYQKMKRSTMMHSYISPQKMSAVYNNRFEVYDELQADLFACGIYAIQMYHMEPMQQLYNKNHSVNFPVLNNYLNQIEESRLKRGIQILLHRNPSVRSNIYHEWGIRCPVLRTLGNQHVDFGRSFKRVPTTMSLQSSRLDPQNFKPSPERTVYQPLKPQISVSHFKRPISFDPPIIQRIQPMIMSLKSPSSIHNRYNVVIHKPISREASRQRIHSSANNHFPIEPTLTIPITRSLSKARPLSERRQTSLEIKPMRPFNSINFSSTSHPFTAPSSKFKFTFQNNNKTTTNLEYLVPSNLKPIGTTIYPSNKILFSNTHIPYQTSSLQNKITKWQRPASSIQTSSSLNFVKRYNEKHQQTQNAASPKLQRQRNFKPLNQPSNFRSWLDSNKEINLPPKEEPNAGYIRWNFKFHTQQSCSNLQKKGEESNPKYQIGKETPRQYLKSPPLNSIDYLQHNETVNSPQKPYQMVKKNSQNEEKDINLNQIKETLANIFSSAKRTHRQEKAQRQSYSFLRTAVQQHIKPENKYYNQDYPTKDEVNSSAHQLPNSKFQLYNYPDDYANGQLKTLNETQQRFSGQNQSERYNDSFKALHKINTSPTNEVMVSPKKREKEIPKVQQQRSHVKREIDKLQQQLQLINQRYEKAIEIRETKRESYSQASAQKPHPAQVSQNYSIAKVTDAPLNLEENMAQKFSRQQSPQRRQNGGEDKATGEEREAGEQGEGMKNELNHSDSLDEMGKNYTQTIVEVLDESTPENSDKDENEQAEEYVLEEYQTGSKYQGHKKRGMRNGHGKFFYQDGGHYEGQWKDNKMHGWGKLYYEDGRLAYQGNWKQDEFHGFGKVYNDNPVNLEAPFDYTNFDVLDDYWIYYQGSLVSDTKEGRGKIKLTNGEIFEGDFHTDRIQGFGKYRTMSGNSIEGIWKDSRLFKIINS